MIENFVEYCKKREGDLVNGKLDNDDLICFEDMQKYWEDYVKLFIPVVTCSANEAITLFNFYAEKSCENIKGQLVPVRKEYLEQYKTMENWLKERHKHYR